MQRKMSRNKHETKMVKVDPKKLVTSPTATYLIQAVLERKHRVPAIVKIPWIMSSKKEMMKQYDKKFEVSIVLCNTLLTQESQHFFTNNLRDKEGRLSPSPVSWLTLNSETGTINSLISLCVYTH